MTETATTISPNASQRILMALKEAKNKIETLERINHHPIAVIGMGCRFPGGSDTPDKFWQHLAAGQNAISDIPRDRFDVASLYDANPDAAGKIYIRKGAFIDRIDYFDPHFFRISPREAEGLDPQQRLTLEVGWEALQHARQSIPSLKGSRTGIFMGMGQNDFARLKFTGGDLTRIDAYDGSGNLSCFASGRLAYFLGTQGPNLVVNTACSSSLVALHLACQSLKSNECDLALAGGVHLILSPEVTVFLCRSHVLAPDGLCKAFDAAANGFSRGEGCGILVLKRYDDAIAQGDTILGLILGSAVNHDGKSGGLTVPNETAQADVIRAAIKNARIRPDSITAIEAHGTGTALGDPIEVSGLAEVFGRSGDHPRTLPLWVSSVKTNIGHLEAAAGVAGVIKTILAGVHQTLPPHLHFNHPNPKIPWDDLPMVVPKELTPWPQVAERRIAGISSYGMSGTNAHIILEAVSNTEALNQAGVINPDYRRERCWIPSPSRMATEVPQTDGHPLIGQRIDLPFSDEIRFQATLTPDSPGYINDHLVYKHRVVPAASHIAAVLTAGQQIYGPETALDLKDILFFNPLIVNAGGGRKVQLIFSPALDKGHKFRLVSQGPAAQTESWIEHVSGTIKPLEDQVAPEPIAPLVQVAPKQESIAQHTFYNQLEQAGFDLGPLFQWGDYFEHRQNTASCRVKAPNGFGDPTQYAIYPGLLDTCFQLLSFFWETAPADLHRRPYLFVPFNVERLVFFQSPDPLAESTCQAQALPNESNGGHLTLCDLSGQTLLSVSGFRFRSAQAQVIQQAASTASPSWFYQITWHPQPIQPAMDSPLKHWLIFGDHQGFGERLAQRLMDFGHTCTLLFQEGHVPAGTAPSQVIDPFSPEQFKSAIAAQEGPEGIPPSNILFLWGLDALGPETLSPVGTMALVHLIQALVRLEQKPLPSITIATDIGWSSMPPDPEKIPLNASLWGLCRSIRHEHPQLKLKLVDLDPYQLDGYTDRLFSELGTDDSALEILYHHNQRHCAQLTPFDPLKHANPPTAAPLFSEKATYLITGGLGGLGLALAKWMVERGAHHFALMGRRPPTADGQAILDQLADRGAKVQVVQGDVSDSAQLDRCLAQITQTMPPLKGVFHAAGINNDGIFLKQTRPEIETVMAPKVQGAWYLHTLTQSMDLDYFVLFSSTAGLLGSPGQSNYAAANAFLDALAHCRQSLGLPALAVNWGPFDRIGMTTHLSTNDQDRWKAMGYSAMTADDAFSHLAQLLPLGISQMAIIAGDPIQIRKQIPDAIPSDQMQTADSLISTPVQGARKAPILTWLAQIPVVEDQKAAITEHTRKRVAEVLKLATPDRIALRQRLFDAGLDSLMAIELKNLLSTDFAREFQATLVFDFPTVEALADHIQGLVLSADSQRQHPVQDTNSTSPEVNTVLAAIGDLSDEAILKKLTRKG